MSSVNYSLNNRGVRLISAEKAWVVGKNGKPKLSPDYYFVGKIDVSMPNILVSAGNAHKPIYKGDTKDLNRIAKNEIVNHFYDSFGKRNKRKVAYFGIKKKKFKKEK